MVPLKIRMATGVELLCVLLYWWKEDASLCGSVCPLRSSRNPGGLLGKGAHSVRKSQRDCLLDL